MGLKKIVGGIVLIVIGIGFLSFGEVGMYLFRPMSTDIESIVNREVPTNKRVRVTGRLEESGWVVLEYEDEKVVGFRSTYYLTDEEGNSILLVSDYRPGEIGDVVTITEKLRYRAYELPGYLIDVKAGAPISIHWFFIGLMLVFTLPGIVLLISGLRER